MKPVYFLQISKIPARISILARISDTRQVSIAGKQATLLSMTVNFRRLAMRHAGWHLPAIVAVACTPTAAFAQATAPSSITPQTLIPAAPTPPPPAIAEPSGLAPPAGSAALKVRLRAIDVDGGFPELADETAAIVAHYVGRSITLAELYAAASAIEAAHVRHGFILARVYVPPQNLVDGGTARIVLVDGFIEKVDASGVSPRARAPVLRRLDGLAGEHHIQLRDIEQPLVLAAAVPGVKLSSTLSRGTVEGGTILSLSGRQALVSGSVSVDNGYAASLGRYAVTAQVSLNSPLGHGEQFYGLVVSGYDLPKALRDDAPLRVFGGGAVFTLSSGRAFLNPEATFSRTQPLPQSGVPTTRGTLRRFSLRSGYVVARTRSRSVGIGAAVEHISEANDAIDFATRLSFDRFTVGRVQATYSGGLRGGGGFSALAQVSHGLEGLDLRVPSNPNDPAPSRQGAHPDFTKAAATLRAVKPIANGWTVQLDAKAQTSFGQPLFRSEQGALEGSDALSVYVGGATAVDALVTGRVELGHALPAIAPLGGLSLSPYLFGAGGIGKVERPTAIETASYSAENVGVGVRAALGRTGLGFAVEYGRGFSDLAQFDKAERLSASASLSF